MDSFQDLTQAVTCRYHDKIKKACTPLFEHFNVNNFWYDAISNSGHHTYVGSHLEWCEYFNAEKLYLNFPYFRHPKFFHSGASVMEGLQDESLMRVLGSARTKFNIHQQSLLLTNKTSNGVELYGFSFKRMDLAMIFNELPLLRLFVKKFREENQFLFSRMKDNLIDLAKLIGPTFYEESAVASKAQFTRRQEFLKKLGIKNPLSPREEEVIKLLNQGYSATQIGKQIFLSPRTIEHHLERMKEKLGCNSKVELIQRARELEYYGLLGG